MTALSVHTVTRQFADVSKRLRLFLGSALGLASSQTVPRAGSNVATASAPGSTAVASAAVAKGRLEMQKSKGRVKEVSEQEVSEQDTNETDWQSRAALATPSTSATPTAATNVELVSNDEMQGKRLRVVVNTESPTTPSTAPEKQEPSTRIASAVWNSLKTAKEQSEANIKRSHEQAMAIEKLSHDKASAFEKASADKVAARLAEVEEEIQRKLAAANTHVKNKVRAAEKAHALLLSKAAKEVAAIKQGNSGVNRDAGDGEFNRCVCLCGLGVCE